MSSSSINQEFWFILVIVFKGNGKQSSYRHYSKQIWFNSVEIEIELYDQELCIIHLGISNSQNSEQNGNSSYLSLKTFWIPGSKLNTKYEILAISLHCTKRGEKHKDELIEPVEVNIKILKGGVPTSQYARGKDAKHNENRDRYWNCLHSLNISLFNKNTIEIWLRTDTLVISYFI